VRRLLAALLLVLAAAPAAGAGEISPRQRALLLLRVLVYDRALAQRAGGEVKVAVVFRPEGDAAEREALLATFEELLEGGFSLALVDRGERAGLMLDPEAAAAAGADFDSALLSVAELVHGKKPAGEGR
jgi:hypothetical protein